MLSLSKASGKMHDVPNSVFPLSWWPCRLYFVLPCAALSDYQNQYETARTSYLDAAKALKMATGPYKASRDAYVAAGRRVSISV